MKRMLFLPCIVAIAHCVFGMEEGMEQVSLQPSQEIYNNLKTTFQFFGQHATRVALVEDNTFFGIDTGLSASKFNYVLFKEDQKKFAQSYIDEFKQCSLFVPACYTELSAYFKREYPWTLQRLALSVLQMPVENCTALEQTETKVVQVMGKGAQFEDFKMIYTHADMQSKEDAQKYMNKFEAESFFESDCPIRLYVVYNTNQQPVSCGVLTHQPGEQYAGIYSVTTHPNERKKGYAKALVQSLAHIAAKEQAHYITLHTVKGYLVEAMKKNGFQEMEPVEIFINRWHFVKTVTGLVANGVYNKLKNLG
ncbi:MAG: GNAT family N-acetyltransferase [Candidatus Babeliales bacterium]